MVPVPLNAVYGYPVISDKLGATVSLRYAGGLPQTLVTGGEHVGAHYDFTALVAVQHGKRAEDSETAEKTMNDIEGLIYTTLTGTKNEHWLKLMFHRPSVRPPALKVLPNTRHGLVYIRLIVNS